MIGSSDPKLDQAIRRPGREGADRGLKTKVPRNDARHLEIACTALSTALGGTADD